jgi:hypothetical protein
MGQLGQEEEGRVGEGRKGRRRREGLDEEGRGGGGGEGRRRMDG